MQFELVVLFQAVLADMVGTLVVGLSSFFLDPRQITVGDAADIAGHVRGDPGQRVLAKQAGLDLDAREAIALGGEPGYFLVGQPGADRDRLEILRFVEQPLEALAILGLNVDDFGQRVDRFLQVAGLRRGDFQRERRIVARQHDTVAVGDDAAVGHDGNQRDPVVVGTGPVKVVLQELQPGKAPDQDAEGRQHDERGDAQPEAEAVALVFVVVKVAHGRELVRSGDPDSARPAGTAAEAGQK